jgi:hygromycin-B 4-O-kinase
MSTAKTVINETLVLPYLRRHFAKDSTALSLLRGGEHSQAFEFHAGEAAFVARVNTVEHAFKKDAYAAKSFASAALPIPEVLHIGKMESEHYVCITPKASGVILQNAFKRSSSKDKLLDAVVEVMEAMRALKIPAENGYGIFDEKGQGKYSSWRRSLLALEHTQKSAAETLARTTCFELSVYEALVAVASSVANDIPEEQSLVHGDFGMDNMLIDGTKVTGVIDWSLAKYGDPIHDAAWLHLWWTEAQFADAYLRRSKFAANARAFPERLRCYAALIAVRSLGFFAFSQQPDKYAWLKARAVAIGLL